MRLEEGYLHLPSYLQPIWAGVKKEEVHWHIKYFLNFSGHKNHLVYLWLGVGGEGWIFLGNFSIMVCQQWFKKNN